MGIKIAPFGLCLLSIGCLPNFERDGCYSDEECAPGLCVNLTCVPQTALDGGSDGGSPEDSGPNAPDATGDAGFDAGFDGGWDGGFGDGADLGPGCRVTYENQLSTVEIGTAGVVTSSGATAWLAHGLYRGGQDIDELYLLSFEAQGDGLELRTGPTRVGPRPGFQRARGPNILFLPEPRLFWSELTPAQGLGQILTAPLATPGDWTTLTSSLSAADEQLHATWNGGGYGLLWRDQNLALYFLAADINGAPIGPSRSLSHAAHSAWLGQEGNSYVAYYGENNGQPPDFCRELRRRETAVANPQWAAAAVDLSMGPSDVLQLSVAVTPEGPALAWRDARVCQADPVRDFIRLRVGNQTVEVAQTSTATPFLVSGPAATYHPVRQKIALAWSDLAPNGRRQLHFAEYDLLGRQTSLQRISRPEQDAILPRITPFLDGYLVLFISEFLAARASTELQRLRCAP